ncbi:MAG: beta-propeller fold lactonase family protein, partial [Candidatus Cybelea sp.]
FAYVTNGASGNVSACAINVKTGALTQVKGSPFAAGDDPSGVAITPAGEFVYVADFISNNVSAYAVNPHNGALQQLIGSPFAAGTCPVAVAIDPTGKFAYVVDEGYMGGGSGISAYAINANSGVLKEIKGSPFEGGPTPTAAAIR